ncbi:MULTISPECIES: alternative ribosome rescue aminoacyl-tRNA hydrolase ArfB [Alkalimonas]|uniref:Alternative ribosome rescue aminoacyl-tRNA hydrolase ArfB n=1 Tax=Alkalimonas mucilaginosa TaxID=3057676 RepID=A0ABU7JJ39_9GAMM|nr:alternative ribosome rescue aminoacyl-tRNA hydrolase ArfB [Alkalimonas sp. MEB004]MEE2025505.1 alternative ribosome rescue aminoacyl-tRNA hydrolase ArfB [Alkalimonas sp. MEB004]
MIAINDQFELAEDELEWQFIRASGPGGQHVNKTSTAVQLVLDIRGSSLPDWLKQRLLNRADHRITQSGKILIKCQQSRSQEQNREQALAQLIQLLAAASVQQKKRTATKPTYGSQQRRIQQKKQRGATKALRQGKPKLE